MGYTLGYETYPSVLAFFRARFEYQDSHYTVLDAAYVAMSEGYAAVRDNRTGQVFAAAFILHMRKHTTGWKDMTEDMGPTIRRCPKRILDQLSDLAECSAESHEHHTGPYSYCPTESARSWRADCRERIARRARKVPAGATVRFANELTFTSGTKLTELTWVKGNTFTTGYDRYRIPGWREMDFEVLHAA